MTTTHHHELTSSLLYLDGVSVSFDGFRALNNLSLTIGAGATVVFTSGAAGFSSGGKGSSGGGSALVPEPSALGLLLVGALGMLTRRRR